MICKVSIFYEYPFQILLPFVEIRLKLLLTMMSSWWSMEIRLKRSWKSQQAIDHSRLLMMGADFPILLDITGSDEITVRRGMAFLSENVGRHPISVVGKVFVLHCTMRRVALYPSVTPDKIAKMLRISDSEILRLPFWLVSYHGYLSDWCHISPLGPKQNKIRMNQVMAGYNRRWKCTWSNGNVNQQRICKKGKLKAASKQR